MIPVYIGDELSAAGYRLAGMRVHTPAAEDVLETFRRTLGETELLLLSVETARHLPAAELNRALGELKPQILIVPDIRGRVPLRDLPTRIRTALGVRV